MRIYGAGLAGLLAANMLRRHEPVICEAQASLPNNHAALLRFRTDAVSRATGIPFRKVRVSKGIWDRDHLTTTTNLRLSNRYSQKVTGEVISRSIINLEPVDRWIAPPDLIKQMAASCRIAYKQPLIPEYAVNKDRGFAIISTIPMPAMMKLADWPEQPEFRFRTIRSLTAEVVSPLVDVYQTIYFPGSEPWYRISLTGKHLTVEIATPDEVKTPADWVIKVVAEYFGLDGLKVTNIQLKDQQYGKITPINEDSRKQFILAMTDRHNIYSLGRFATWRNILLDDVVHDVEVLEQFVSQRDSYSQKLAAHQV